MAVESKRYLSDLWVVYRGLLREGLTYAPHEFEELLCRDSEFSTTHDGQWLAHCSLARHLLHRLVRDRGLGRAEAEPLLDYFLDAWLPEAGVEIAGVYQHTEARDSLSTAPQWLLAAAAFEGRAEEAEAKLDMSCPGWRTSLQEVLNAPTPQILEQWLEIDVPRDIVDRIVGGQLQAIDQISEAGAWRALDRCLNGAETVPTPNKHILIKVMQSDLELSSSPDDLVPKAESVQERLDQVRAQGGHRGRQAGMWLTLFLRANIQPGGEKKATSTAAMPSL